MSERLIAETLYPYQKGLVIATKGGLVRPGPGNWVSDGRPQHLRAACEASLKRLRLERIDLYQLHAVDDKVPLEVSMGELVRLQKEGKIRHIGVSNMSVDELARARRVAKVVSIQNRYNVADRSSQDVLVVCERDGIAFIPWGPLAQGARDQSAPQRNALEDWAKARRSEGARSTREPDAVTYTSTVSSAVAGPVLVTEPRAVMTQPEAWYDPMTRRTWLFIANHRGVSGFVLEVNDGEPELVPMWMTRAVQGTSPVLANGMLFVATNFALRALDPATGAVLWEDLSIGNIHWQSPIIVNRQVFIADHNGHLYSWLQ